MPSAELLVCEGSVGRHLTQNQPGIAYPGCTPYQNSVVATNPDFSTLHTGLQQVGLDATLSTLTSPYTLFAPTNEAFDGYNVAAGISNAEGSVSPFLLAGF